MCIRDRIWSEDRWVGHDDANACLSVMKRTIPPHLFVFIRSFHFSQMVQQQQPQQLYHELQSAAVARTQQVVLAVMLPTEVLFWMRVGHGDDGAPSLPTQRNEQSQRSWDFQSCTTLSAYITNGLVFMLIP